MENSMRIYPKTPSFFSFENFVRSVVINFLYELIREEKKQNQCFTSKLRKIKFLKNYEKISINNLNVN